MPKFYLDNAAATPIAPEVQKEVIRAMGIGGNPSSFNNAGREAAEELKKARLMTARFLGAHSNEIVFTSSGTEANNLAILGVAKWLLRYCANALQTKKRPHIITTRIEHPSVLGPIGQLEREGFNVTYLSVDKDGFINLDELKKDLRPETVLVSVMYANNEIGTIQPIRGISKIIKSFKIHEKADTLFHVDACQAVEFLDINVNNLEVDLLTFNGSKIYGPRGVGVLYTRKGAQLKPLVFGGDQEGSLRAGTENLPAIVGLAKATGLIDRIRGNKLARLRDYFIERMTSVIPESKINGPMGQGRLPNNINVSIPGADSENLLLELDKHGISAGSGSACTSHSVEPSHVLKAIGLEKKYLSGALRFSIGRQTTKKDIDYVLKVLPSIVTDLKKRYKK